MYPPLCCFFQSLTKHTKKQHLHFHLKNNNKIKIGLVYEHQKTWDFFSIPQSKHTQLHKQLPTFTPFKTRSYKHKQLKESNNKCNLCYVGTGCAFQSSICLANSNREPFYRYASFFYGCLNQYFQFNAHCINLKPAYPYLTEATMMQSVASQIMTIAFWYFYICVC